VYIRLHIEKYRYINQNRINLHQFIANELSRKTTCLRAVWGVWMGVGNDENRDYRTWGTFYSMHVTGNGTNTGAVLRDSTNNESISTLKECLTKESVMIRCHKTVPASPGYFQWRRTTVRDDLRGNSHCGSDRSGPALPHFNLFPR